jgi:hypothetical protein
MRRGRTGGVVAAFVAAVLLAVPLANAATPREIYRDYADNGRLDRTYSSADLQRAYKDALVQGYGKPTVVSGIGQEAQAAERGLPFTGTDLTLIVLAGLALVLFGAGLRRAVRRKT